MFCNQCGQAVPPGSHFCNNCGSPVKVSGEAPRRGNLVRPASDLRNMAASAAAEAEEEQVIFTLKPTMVFVIVWYVIAALILLATSAVLGWMRWNQWITDSVAFLVILVVGLVAFAIPVYKHILRRREVYTLTNHKLEMRYGIIAKTVRNIPLRNIQDVTVTASVWQRLLRLGDIVIDSASETGRIHLDEIHNPDRYANMILAELRRRN